ncbi:MAG: 30S ribosomal protein S5 [Candidatus Altarchaeaceae archaeon]
MALEKKQIKEVKKKSKRRDRRFGRKIGKRRKETGVDLSRGGYVKEFATEEQWIPKTSLGMKVYNGEIKTIDEVLESGKPIREPEIVDRLLPNLDSEIVYDLRVQRVTMNGRVMRYKVTVVVGNRDGYIGIGHGKAKEKPIAIRYAIADAKKNIKKIERGCSSWFCNCGKPHTVPYKVTGECGSVRVTLIPASAGTGLVASPVVKKVLELAGISDIYVYTEGHTRTSMNLAAATIDGLVKATQFKKLSG